MIKTVVEAGLAAELTEHLGYEKGDPVGRGTPNEPCSDGRNAWWVYVNMWTAEGGGSDLVVVGVVWDDEESVLLEIFDVYVM